MGLADILESLCKPLLFFIVFESALITYFLSQFQLRNALINTIMAFIGSGLIYLLCILGFETAAWILLAILPFFFIMLLAFLVIKKIIPKDITALLDKRVDYNREPEEKYDYVENPALDEVVSNYSYNFGENETGITADTPPTPEIAALQADEGEVTCDSE